MLVQFLSLTVFLCGLYILYIILMGFYDAIDSPKRFLRIMKYSLHSPYTFSRQMKIFLGLRFLRAKIFMDALVEDSYILKFFCPCSRVKCS